MGARLTKQTLIERVAHQRVLERIIVRYLVSMDRSSACKAASRPSMCCSEYSGQGVADQTACRSPRPLVGAHGLFRETVYARGQQALHTCRQSCRYAFASKSNCAVGAYNTPFREKADNFLSEEWIALSLLSHLPRERLGESLNAKPRSYKSADVADGQRFQRQVGDHRSVEPRRRVFRAARR